MVGDISRLPFDLAGYTGASLYLLAFALLQAGVIRGTSYPYIVMNILAAGLVLTSLAVAFNLSSAIIQISWISIGIFGLLRRYMQNRRIRFSEAEEKLRLEVFGGVEPALVRKFLDTGTWTSLPAGATLMRESETVETLYFIVEGEAEARLDEHPVGLIKHGFIGEMNILRAGPASASVIAMQECRVFVASGEKLRRLCARDPEMRALIEDGLSRDTRQKLLDANTRLKAAQAKP